MLLAEERSVPVGGAARLVVHSGLADQDLELEIHRSGVEVALRRLDSAAGLQVIEIPITAELRGGFGLRLTALRDHQLMRLESSVFVPWDDRELAVEFATFRDRLRPGERETWRVRVSAADERALAAGSAELLAYMYDRSLDLTSSARTVPRTRSGSIPTASTSTRCAPTWASRGRCGAAAGTSCRCPTIRSSGSTACSFSTATPSAVPGAGAW